MTFKKGESGNPKGLKKIPDFVKVVQQYSREIVEIKIAELMQKPLDEIKDMSVDHERQALDVFLAKIITMGVVEGDYQRLNFLFDRTIGKVPNQLNFGEQQKPLRLAYSLENGE